jgi:hypothetical protein
MSVQTKVVSVASVTLQSWRPIVTLGLPPLEANSTAVRKAWSTPPEASVAEVAADESGLVMLVSINREPVMVIEVAPGPAEDGDTDATVGVSAAS